MSEVKKHAGMLRIFLALLLIAFVAANESYESYHEHIGPRLLQ